MSRFFSVTVLVALLAGAPSAVSAQWLNYPTPGIPRLSGGKPNLRAPAPRMPDGKPDLSGIWDDDGCHSAGVDCGGKNLFFDLARDLKASDVEMTPWATGIQAQRVSRNHVDDPIADCLPAGMPRMAFWSAFKILQTPSEMAFLYEGQNGPLFRQILTDGRPLPPIDNQTWMGYSIGRWEGDTFVVETQGFRDGGWLDTRAAHPNSDALRLSERYRRVDFGKIDWIITIDDPKAYRKPWTVKTALYLVPDTELIEGFCAEGEADTIKHRRITPPPPEPPSVPVPR
ncbi:MAG: hypothetical protein ABSG41_16915 [Bryobacteraceae bacterium]|jgi:hypothetical protein